VNTTTNAEAVASMRFEVFKNGKSTGRKFTSLISAQSYARSIGGEVMTVG